MPKSRSRPWILKQLPKAVVVLFVALLFACGSSATATPLPASATAMVKKLAAEGFLKHMPYRGFTLRPKGRDLALRMLRRHRLIELFLVPTLWLGWDEVHADA